MKNVLAFWQGCFVVSAAVVVSGCSRDACANFPMEFSKTGNLFTEDKFIPDTGDFAPLPSNFSEINGLINSCGARIDDRIGPRSLENYGAVRISERYFLRYIPNYTTDTVYYFEVVDGLLQHAYQSQY